VSLGWTAATDDAAVTAYRVYRDGVLIATLGTSLSTTVTGLTKGTTYLFKVEAGDAAGNYSTTGPSTSFVAVPVLAAPPLDRTVTTDIASATAFLYTGTDPVQTGVVPGTIDPVRVGVLRGRATTTTGAALPGIAVSVLGHPEFGSTVSRADGAFDLAVNGGGDLTLRYVKPGFPELQRTLNVPWRMYAIAPDVILTPYDTANTAITLSSLTGIAVHRASTSSDLDASRRPTLLFSPGTTATMTLADGTVTPIDTLHVRATEFTVGESGPNAMPADLPPTSHYTYSAEWSVDEAVAASASRVSFSQPVVLYLENFLSFPTGTIVPEGTYDRAVAHWSAEPNGRVVKVLSMTGGRANLDIDGSGSPASAAALLALGVTDAERDQVATLYAVGQSLWRVPLMHFSACDLNWAVASGGPPKAKPGKEPTECAQEEHGSIIECENQLLGENLSIAGTPFQLHYHSDRSHLASRNQVSHAFPADVDFLDGFLAVEVAGRSLIATAKPGDSVTIEWDGYDAYGRFTNGRQPARVSIGYHRKAVYKSTPSFGGTTGATLAAITAASGRKALWLYTSYHTRLGTYDAHPTGLGGWEIDAHHFYSPGSRIAYFGNGKRRGSNGATPTQFIQTVAGGGVGGDGGPATGASLNTPFGLAIAPDGSLYIADRDANRIRRVDPAGIITTFAGGGTLTGDDILATDAKLSLSTAPWTSIAIGPDGAVYFTEGTRIDVVRAGKIRRYAGTGVTGFSGDGGPARSAQINQPAALTFGPRGLYFSDGATRVRLIDLTTELIQTIAGTGDPGDFGYGDGGQATAASMTPNGLAFDAAGRMYITDFGGLKSKIRRVDTAGVITTIAGSSSGFSGDGGSPLAARLFAPAGIAIGRDAAIYFADNNNGRIRRISPDESVILTVAGNGAGGSTPIGEGLSPTDAMLAGPAAIAFGPEGSLYIADVLNHRIRRIVNALPGFTAAEITLPAESGSSLFVFDSLGRHLKTLDTLTGKTLLTFGYDTSGRLASITDLDGDVTTITRSGSSFDITGPFGQKTTVVVGTDGNASKVTNPAGDSVSMTYEPGFGFLKTLTDPRGGLHTFTFDEVGRLEKDEGPGGWSLTLTRPTAIEFDVRTVSAEGRSKEHQLFELPTGGERRITTSTAGVSTITDMPSNHSATSTAPDGTISTRSLVPDPRFGFNSPILGPSRVTTPAGLVATASAGRAVLLTLPSDPTSVKTLIESFTVNGQTFTSTYDAPTRKVTATTPLGRKSITTLDTNGRPVQSSVTGFTPVDVVYDAHGRPTSVTQGTRSVTYAYGSDGLLASVTDPLLRTTSFTRDAIGRVLKQTLPDLREVSFTYDASGNVTSVTPPTRPVHSFTYTAADQPNNYIAPTVGTETPVTTYAYNKDHQVTSVTRPDGSFVGFTYDFAGRPSIVTHATDITTMTYDGAERLSTIANTPETITFTYDGSLVTDTTWTGAVAGVVHRDYDANFRVKTQSVNSAFPITLTYDNDGLLTGAGSLVLTRDTTNGVLKGTTLGSVTDTITLSAFGELASYKATYATTTSLYEATFTRDSVGRISTKTEIVGGVTKTYGYTYDTAGRLTDVTLGGTLTAHYGYDGNSNRATKTAGGTTTTGAYDAQDRLITYGTKTYIFTTNGELKTVSDTATGLVTNYAYDALGNLLSVTPSVGAKIEYIVDGANRRVGKKVAGVLTQAWIYQNALKPVASLDPISGAVLQRYVYGSRGVVPDYVVTPTATYRVISDHLGSPRVVVDVATGAIVQRTDYDEFGNVTAETIATGWTALPFGFAGGMYDRDTKLVRFGARDYDGENGRWTTKDPIGFGGGAANFYGYAANDPVNGADPTGLLLGVTWNDVDYALTTHGEDIALGVAAVSIAPLAVYGVSYAAIAADAAFGAAAMHVLTRAGPAIGALLGFGQRGCDFARKLAADTSGSLSLPSATTEPAKQLGSSGVFHHIFPRAFAGRFAQLGINVDNFTMRIAPSLHNSIHEPPFTSGGWWNAAWATWFANNPNATAKDAFIFAGELIHKFGLSGGPVVPYPH